MRLSIFQSFRSMLFSLVLLSVLPALGIILYNGLVSRDAAVLNARKELIGIVTALAGAQQRTADVTRQTLATLAIMDEVRNQDVTACAAVFTRILLNNPLYTNMALTDRDGGILVSAMPMAFASLADRKHFKDAVRTGDFAPGEYIVSRATSVSSFPFAFPILDDQGEVSGVLTVALDLSKFHAFFAGQHLPEGSFLGIADHEGRRLFRSFTDESFPVGAYVSPVAWKQHSRTWKRDLRQHWIRWNQTHQCVSQDQACRTRLLI
jgi:two-component system, sensor histidine kinase